MKTKYNILAITRDIMFLESIGRDPTGFNYYRAGRKSAKNIKGKFLYVETSPESEVFVKISFGTISKLASQFNDIS